MPVDQAVSVDVLIVGGGIAGLWTLAKLRHAGYRAVLIESEALGHGQTRFA
jgi:glycerol-3-phosphate dehydrogenase